MPPSDNLRSSNALWWRPGEISSLDLTPGAEAALVNAWNVLWPQA